MNKLFKKSWAESGESLIETVVSIAVLAMGGLGATAIIFSSLIAGGVSRDRVIATNLAREGIEVVRSIRDTNWLKYSIKKRECWNWDENSGKDCDGSGNNLIKPGYYTAYFDDDYKWKLRSYSAGSNIMGRQLVLYDTDNDGKEDLYNDGNIPFFNKVKYSVFHREIEIRYYQDLNSNTFGTSDNNIMEVIAKVQWRERGRDHDVVLVTRLTDFLDRKNHL